MSWAVRRYSRVDFILATKTYKLDLLFSLDFLKRYQYQRLDVSMWPAPPDYSAWRPLVPGPPLIGGETDGALLWLVGGGWWWLCEHQDFNHSLPEFHCGTSGQRTSEWERQLVKNRREWTVICRTEHCTAGYKIVLQDKSLYWRIEHCTAG